MDTSVNSNLSNALMPPPQSQPSTSSLQVEDSKPNIQELMTKIQSQSTPPAINDKTPEVKVIFADNNSTQEQVRDELPQETSSSIVIAAPTTSAAASAGKAPTQRLSTFQNLEATYLAELGQLYHRLGSASVAEHNIVQELDKKRKVAIQKIKIYYKEMRRIKDRVKAINKESTFFAIKKV